MASIENRFNGRFTIGKKKLRKSQIYEALEVRGGVEPP